MTKKGNSETSSETEEGKRKNWDNTIKQIINKAKNASSNPETEEENRKNWENTLIEIINGAKNASSNSENIWTNLSEGIIALQDLQRFSNFKQVHEIIGSICAYNGMDLHDRIRNKGIYIANKGYLRSTYPKIWKELKEVQWRHANSILQRIMKPVGWWSDNVANMKDFVKYPKEIATERLLSTFLSRKEAVDSMDKIYVALAGIISILGVIGESLSVIKTTGKNRRTQMVVFMLSELNKAIIGSSLSYKTIFRLLLRIFELMGVVKTSYVFNAMSLLKTTPEYILQDSPLAKDPALPKFLRGELSESQASGFMRKTLETLERGRVKERLENKADNIISKTLESFLDRTIGKFTENVL